MVVTHVVIVVGHPCDLGTNQGSTELFVRDVNQCYDQKDVRIMFPGLSKKGESRLAK